MLRVEMVNSQVQARWSTDYILEIGIGDGVVRDINYRFEFTQG